jgi:hypothetical protein
MGHGLLEATRFVLFEGVEIIEAAQEQQIGDLFHDLKRVGNATGPEGVPDAVDLVPNVACQHEKFL